MGVRVVTGVETLGHRTNLPLWYTAATFTCERLIFEVAMSMASCATKPLSLMATALVVVYPYTSMFVSSIEEEIEATVGRPTWQATYLNGFLRLLKWWLSIMRSEPGLVDNKACKFNEQGVRGEMLFEITTPLDDF
jgi:hypothetical protein